MIGKTIGHYQITEKIGEGGMGEVYKADDTKLGRPVAVKRLPEVFKDDEERLARFDREARLLAALNHPNIAAIHGIEEDNGEPYLILEFVPGETLDHILTSGPLVLDEALEFFRQIAEGLEVAHESGVVHRDLKPANIRITPDRQVKLLDFGLGKSLIDQRADPDSTQLTTTPQSLTGEGVILGTVWYMSPEQIRGRNVNKRADIWAFGCMLYETLTGNRVFAGEMTTEVIAAILDRDPDWDVLPSGTPPAILNLLHWCLQKDPKQRLRDIGDARIILEEAISGSDWISVNDIKGSPPQISMMGKSIPWGIATLTTLALLILLFWPRRDDSRLFISGTKHFEVEIMPLSLMHMSVRAPGIALSSNGSLMACIVLVDGIPMLQLRKMDTGETVIIEGTEGAKAPFFSPDGTWIAYLDQTNGNTKMVSPSLGGPPQVVCGAADIRGGSWSTDGSIYLTPTYDSGIHRVTIEDGILEPVTQLDLERGEKSHRFPELLPGEEALLFNIGTTSMTTWDEAEIAIVSLRTGQVKTIYSGGMTPKYMPTGHIIFGRSGALYAMTFDLERLEVIGEPVKVLDGVMTIEGFGTTQYALSGEGTLVYMPGGSETALSRMVWVNRTGHTEPVPGAPDRPYLLPELSPDGNRIATGLLRANNEIWIYDLERGTITLRVQGGGDNSYPHWTPDGERLVFSSLRTGRSQMFWILADGSAEPEQLLDAENQHLPVCFTRDGSFLVYLEIGPQSGMDIMILPLAGDRIPREYLKTGASESAPDLSPDDRWLAYSSNKSGRNEVYIRSFPDPDREIQISTNGGNLPQWSRDGRELFYLEGDRFLVVDITPGPEISPSRPRFLFERPEFRYSEFRNFDIAPNGERFLSTVMVEKAPIIQLNVIINWQNEISRLAPSPR